MRTKEAAFADELEPELQELVAPRIAPGKRTRAERLPPRPTAALPPHTAHHAAPAPRPTADPFGLHLLALPALEASPPSVCLRGAAVGRVQVSNRERTPVELVDLHASHPGLHGWVIGPRTLAPGASTVITVTYEPATPGALTGTITLLTADGTTLDIPVDTAEARA